MIKKPPVLRISRQFRRAPQDLLSRLTGAATGHVVDVLGGRAALDFSIKAIPGTPMTFTGSALTVYAGPGDCLATFAALEEAKPGDVLLVCTDRYREAAAAGDLLLAIAKGRGVVAFVTDGLVRDIPGIVSQNLPCFAAGVTPNSAQRTGPGTVGFPMVLGNLHIGSGDIVIGDQDGVVIVPQSAFGDILNKIEAVRKAEAEIEAAISKSSRMPDFVESFLADVDITYEP